MESDSDESLPDDDLNGSDIDVGDSGSERSFESETDSDDDEIQATPSTLASLDSQTSIPTGDDFWTDQLEPVNLAAFESEVGPSHDLPDDASPLAFFHLMLGEDLFQLLADETNRYAEQKQEVTPDHSWTPTSIEEIKSLIGLYILMGVNRLPDYSLYWSENPFLGNQGFKAAMPKHRFEKLMQYLHINNNQTQQPRGSDAYDRLHKIRPLIKTARSSFLSKYQPGKHQTIDEGMVRYKGDYFAKQYMPKKPIKRGLKIWMRCETSGYCCDFRIYLGKHDEFRGRKLGERVVKHLCRPLKWKGHHVIFDNYFTTVSLVQSLEQNGIYACGTIKSNATGLPAEIKDITGLQRGDAEQWQHGNMVATLWMDGGLVTLLSTTSDPLGDGPAFRRVRGNPIVVARPPPVEHYQKYMGGVDRCMQFRAKNPVGRSAKKWWKFFFRFILELSVINSFIIFKESAHRNNMSLLEFQVQIGQALVGQFTSRKRRYHQPIPGTIQATALPLHQSTRLCIPKGRCKWCLRRGTRRETRNGCNSCKVHLCPGGCFQAYHNDLVV